MVKSAKKKKVNKICACGFVVVGVFHEQENTDVTYQEQNVFISVSTSKLRLKLFPWNNWRRREQCFYNIYRCQ